MKSLLKKLAARVPFEIYERFSAYSLLRGELAGVGNSPHSASRRDLWAAALSRIPADTRVAYVEFGVFQGDSIKYFAAANSNPESIFVGMDSFEGLPEDWGHMAKGTFTTGGRMPQTDDRRIHFVKGWFQDTWHTARALLEGAGEAELIAHYDADLYSSTLFALAEVDAFKRPYWAIFDEFTGHETRALHNYCQAYSATVEFLGQACNGGEYPEQVLCRITPRRHSASA